MKTYQAKDIERLLGVSHAELFRWSRVWELFTPAQMGKGRRSKNRYNFINLLEIALVRELAQWGVDLRVAQSGFNGRILFPEEISDEGIPIYRPGADLGLDCHEMWEFIQRNRRKFEKEGCVLVFRKTRNLDFLEASLHAMPNRSAARFVTPTDITPIGSGGVSVLMVDLMQTLRHVEQVTGDKLGE